MVRSPASGTRHLITGPPMQLKGRTVRSLAARLFTIIDSWYQRRSDGFTGAVNFRTLYLGLAGATSMQPKRRHRCGSSDGVGSAHDQCIRRRTSPAGAAQRLRRQQPSSNPAALNTIPMVSTASLHRMIAAARACTGSGDQGRHRHAHPRRRQHLHRHDHGQRRHVESRLVGEPQRQCGASSSAAGQHWSIAYTAITCFPTTSGRKLWTVAGTINVSSTTSRANTLPQAARNPRNAQRRNPDKRAAQTPAATVRTSSTETARRSSPTAAETTSMPPASGSVAAWG